VGSNFTIRPLASTAEFKECVRFQEETWGEGFSERVPLAIVKVTQRAAGAFDAEDALTGFVFGMTGVQDGQVIHWSDMLAVRPELHDVGLRLRLKAYHREELVLRGGTGLSILSRPRTRISTSTSSGPCLAREYVPDMYGRTDFRPHKGIGTERFVPTWAMDSPRVTERFVEGVPARPRVPTKGRNRRSASYRRAM